MISIAVALADRDRPSTVCAEGGTPQSPRADRRRLDVIPGLTSIWQVSGRGDIPFLQQIAFDVQCIQSQNVWVDIKLLLQTFPQFASGKARTEGDDIEAEPLFRHFRSR